MNCFKPKTSKTPALIQDQYSPVESVVQELPDPKNVSHEVLLRIPSCRVHLMDGGEALELGGGDFTAVRISDENVCLATIIKVGEDLQWPLTKDEPVVRLDASNYLFSLPMKDGDLLSYGVTFRDQKRDGINGNLNRLDSFLNENSCFSSSALPAKKKDIDWEEFAPKIEDYNHVLAKAIAGGTGQIVKGIFKCSNAYSNQVQKGGKDILIRAVEERNSAKVASGSERNRGDDGASKKRSKVNKSLKRVRKLSRMTEKMSKTMLNGVGIVTGAAMKPVVRSQAGKAFLSMVPGEVILASLDAVNKILDAAEVAEKRAFAATSGAAGRMVSKRFGENAGEATEDVMATAGHCLGIAWNVFKIRKAINPASSVSSGMLRTARNMK